ncbi:hypothetical protein D3C85_987610 [compost metagenome]
MHPRQVVGLAVVLHRQLPVAVHLQAQRAAHRLATHQAHAVPAEELFPAHSDRRQHFLQRRGLAGQVDEHHAHPDLAAQRLQAVLLAGEALVLVLVDATDVRGALEAAVEVVGPRVVGAAQHTLHFAFLVHQLHAAVAADVVEHLHQALAVAHQQQRQAHEVHRLDEAVLRQVALEADAGPGAAHQLVALEIEEALIGVELVAQAGGFMDRGQHRFQHLGGDEARGGVGHCYSPLLARWG